MLITLLLCGCGKQREESNIPASAPAASAETEGNSLAEETAAETETVSAESESETAPSETEANTEEATTAQVATTAQAATTGQTTATTEQTPTDVQAADENSDAHSDFQNPIMNFIGYYQSGRATMFVESSKDNTAKIKISWGNSADSATVWTMSGECVTDDDSVTVFYHDSVCKNMEYNSDGTVKSETTGYTDGSGSITFRGNTAKWNDDIENVGDTMVFDYVIQ